MNKFLIWFPAALVFGAVIYKPVRQAAQPHLVEKNVSFALYKGSSYTSGVYNNTSVQVHMTVEKVSNRGERTIVWDRTFDSKSLSQLPSLDRAMKQNIKVAGINQKKEY